MRQLKTRNGTSTQSLNRFELNIQYFKIRKNREKNNNMTKMKKRHILHWAMGVVMTPLLGSCAFDELHEIAGGGNGVLSFGVEVNAGAPEVKPMGGATRSGDRADSSATGNAVMSPDVEGFFPTSSVELSSVDGKTLYANCDERRGIRMHNNVDYKTTRGSIQTTENFYASFALYGYVYDSGKNWKDDGGSTDVDSKIKGITMSKSGNGNDYNASGVYWPGGSNKATFFAVAPYSANQSVTANQGGPQITYTVPQTVSDQKDLLLAFAKDVKCDGKNAPNPLTFNHALAAIKFEKGDLPASCTVKNVEISGVKNKGDLSSFESPEWSNQSIDGSGTNTYTITNLDKDVMFLMPQTFTDAAEIKLTLSDESYYTAKLKEETNTSWQAGHQYTYKLSVNKVTGTFNFEVSPSTVSVAIGGGTATFTVKSYFKYQDNTTTAISWSGTYTVGDTPTTVSGTGGNEGESVKIKIGNNSSTSSTLTTNPSKGTMAKPWNLSNSQGEPTVENTANCYVVNSKGIYSIPLVYGCAIKDGQPNEISYKSDTFVNHAGEHITKPYIFDMVSANGAKLIWQDVQNMVTEVGLSSDNKSLIFKIGDNIAQGNVVVAATASGTVVWSWHIWVTDRDVSVNAAIPTKAFDPNYTYNFMPVPLGWCDGTTSTVAPRNFTLSLTQGQSGKILSASIAQAGSTATSGNFTYYQWGRKDPFVGSTGTNSNTCKTWYDGNGQSKTSLLYSSSTRTKKYGITNPGYFIYGSSQWDGATTYDDWNANLESTTAPTSPFNYTEVKKTVYDPSPVGYKLPPTNAFTGFGKKWGNEVTPNGSSFSDGGWNFYTGGQSKGPTDFWIAGGYRSWSGGSLSGVGSGGYCWSAGPRSDTNGCYLYFNSGYVYPHSSNYRAYGFPVRPVSEQ